MYIDFADLVSTPSNTVYKNSLLTLFFTNLVSTVVIWNDAYTRIRFIVIATLGRTFFDFPNYFFKHKRKSTENCLESET